METPSSSTLAVRDETGWALCLVKGKDKSGNLLVQTMNGGKRLKVKKEDAQYVDGTSSAASVVDVLNLENFNEASVYLTLLERAEKHIVYTYAGRALVFINPKENLPLYGPDVQRMYKRAGAASQLPPHLYAIVRQAYEDMLADMEETQTILLSGRVGSGKSEALRQCVRFLACLEPVRDPKKSQQTATAGGMKSSECVLLGCSVLEAFGNASIRENSNSSRHGRLLRIFFDKCTGGIVGGNVVTYLFERTRVSRVRRGERNFHIFYQLVKGASDEDRRTYFLLPVQKYRYLTMGGVVDVSSSDDDGDFERTKNLMVVLGLSRSLQASIFRILSAILHLGNVTFLWDNAAQAMSLKSDKPLKLAANLLGIDNRVLLAVMTTAPQAPTLDDEEAPPFTKAAEDMRDLIAQNIYAKLFSYVANAVNERMAPPRGKTSTGVISILDQFGFEDCQLNGLHQLTVNYATERLYFDLIESRNSDEQDMYIADGGAWEKLPPEAQETLQVFDAPETGMWDILTDLSGHPDSVDLDILDRLFAYNVESTVLDRLETRYEMSVSHLSSQVTYDVKGFLVDNQEMLPGDLATSLLESSAPLVRGLFESAEEESPVLSARAVSDLDLVLSMVGPSRLHQVYCVAPNAIWDSSAVDGNLVAWQINSCGIITTGFLRRDGFMALMSLQEALQRYVVLLQKRPVFRKPAVDLDRLLKAVFERRTETSWLIGREHVYLSKDIFLSLESKRHEKRVKAAHSLVKVITRARFFRRLFALLQKRKSLASPRRVAGQSASLTPEAANGARRAINTASMQLNKQAFNLQRAVSKEPVARAEINVVLAEMQQAEGEFFEPHEPFGDGLPAEYSDALHQVKVTLAEYLKSIRAASRPGEGRAEAVQHCKALHQDFVAALREWRPIFVGLDLVGAAAGAGGGGGGGGGNNGVTSPRFRPVVGLRGSVEAAGERDSNSATRATPSMGLRRLASASGRTLSVGDEDSNSNSAQSPPISSSPRKALPPLMGGRNPPSAGGPNSPRINSSGSGSGSGSGGSAPTVAAVVGSPRGLQRTASNVVFHDSPKIKRRAAQKEIVGKMSAQGGSQAMRAALDKLDAQIAMKELKKDHVVIQFQMPDGLTVRTKVPSKMLCSDAKQYMIEKAASYSNSMRQWNSPADYLLKVYGAQATIQNEAVPLSRVGYVQACNYIYVTPILELTLSSKWSVRSEVDLTTQTALELKLSLVISKLIGKEEFASYLQNVDDEIDEFRAAMTHARLEHAKELAVAAKEGRLFMLHEYLDAEPLPPTIPVSVKVNVSFDTSGADRSSTLLDVRPQETVVQLMEKAVQKLRKMDPSRSGARTDHYLLKETGRQSFLLGDTPLLRYDAVRGQICADKSVALTLVEKGRTLDSYGDDVLSGSYLDRVLEGWINERSTDLSPEVCDFLTPKNAASFSRPWRIKAHGVQGIPERYLTGETARGEAAPHQGDPQQERRWVFFLRVTLFAGDGDTLMPPQYTKPVEASFGSVRWDQWIFGCPVNQIPRGARCSLSCHAVLTGSLVSVDDDVASQSDMLGWYNFPMWKQDGTLVSGENLHGFQLWPASEQFDVTCLHNVFSDLWLYVKFEETKRPIVYPPPALGFRLSGASQGQLSYVVAEKRIAQVLNVDLLTTLTGEEKKLLWENRSFLTNNPRALPRVLQSTKWADFAQAQDMYTLMYQWCELKPAQILFLLSGAFLDPVIREFAVERLKRLTDADLLQFVPQLTQALKLEPYLFNPLAEFLVDRSLRNRHRLGHMFFWALKAEMHLPKIVGRYACILESYLRGAGTHRNELEMQADLVSELVGIAKGLKQLKEKPEREDFLRSRLGSLKLPGRFQLPLDPRYEVSGLIVAKCKFMDSKKVPLWLVFKNAEEGAPPITVIFKEGDDLRQDILTIQMLKLMSTLWKREGIDLGMNPYGCISCGDQIGMIEVVGNAQTTAGVAREFGGVKAVFRKDVMVKWLQQHNETPEKYARAQQNFMRSCAAYCVATYVLGIGDRHNDNIMCTRDGYFFHIDFGHFLGNFKKKLGIDREKAPFVFTQQYAAVLGGTRKAALFKDFVDLCGRIFNIIRREADLFVTLFQMMTLTGIPELRDSKDIEYLTKALHLEMTEFEAAKFFDKLIDESLASRTTVLNHAVHSFVH